MTVNSCSHNFVSINGEECPKCINIPNAPESEKNPISVGSNPNMTNGHNPEELETSPEAVKNELKNENLKTGTQTNVLVGDRSTIYLTQNEVSSNSPDDELQTISLYNDSEPLEIESFENSYINIEHLLQDLKRQRICLLGDSGDSSVLKIAKQIVLSFDNNYKKENTKLLRISDFKQNSLTVASLSFERKISEEEVQDAIIIVDATDGGQGFADSLLNPKNLTDLEYYPSKLRKNKLYMICLFKAEAFEYWIDRNDSKIYPYKIFPKKPRKIQIDEDEAEVIVNIKRAFETKNQTEFLIIRTIWFIVAFFHNLTTEDFNALVSYWLKIESVSLNEELSDNDSKDAGSKKIDIYKIWKARSQFFSQRCFLIQTKDDSSGKRTIGFRSESCGKLIRENLETFHWAFVEEKVSEMMEMLLIFHISGDIADQSMSVQFEYLPGNEETFIKRMLLIFEDLKNAEKRKNSEEKKETPTTWDEGQECGILGDKEEINDIFHCYNRLEQLFRKILRDSSLSKLVTSIIEKLIQSKNFQSALRIVKRLKSAPGFDEIRWFKQIYERGDEPAKIEIRKYFFGKIRNSDFEEARKKLRDWLPAEDAPVEKYLESNKMALNLLVEYYSYLTDKYDKKLYGIEPTQFALFDFENKETAEIQIDKIIGYLLHPANLKFDLKGISYENFVAILLKIWNKILCKDNFSKPNSDDDKSAIRNKEILNIILEKVILYSDKEFQENIKLFWKEMSHSYRVMSKAIKDKDWETSEKLSDDFELMENLIEDFTDQQSMN